MSNDNLVSILASPLYTRDEDCNIVRLWIGRFIIHLPHSPQLPM